MTTVRQRRKQKTSLHKTSRRVKDKQRKVRIRADPLIATHWDEKLTVSQNYKKMGLVARVGGVAGGTEKDLRVPRAYISKAEKAESAAADKAAANEAAVPIMQGLPQATSREARIVRHEDGRVEVVYADSGAGDDPADDSSFEKASGLMTKPAKVVPAKTSVAAELEALANRPVEKKERTASERESDWIQALVTKHGDDYEAMFRDRKLNVWQQSVGDIRKRVVKWQRQQK
ncbi:ribosome biogenesis protein Nop16 [Dipodascopsis tothii]|uniref:ribosome biogenesis protein Nop16 n=1 Tax=Dipodascopsis tothii TaxID=44089 RepID=UPI0034CDA9C0